MSCCEICGREVWLSRVKWFHSPPYMCDPDFRETLCYQQGYERMKARVEELEAGIRAVEDVRLRRGLGISLDAALVRIRDLLKKGTP